MPPIRLAIAGRLGPGLALAGLAAVILACGSGCAQTGAGEPPAGHPALVVGTDMGLDDVRAVYALLGDRAVDLEAVVTVDGSAAVGKATDNLLGLLEDCGVDDVPVITGTDVHPQDPPPWRQTANALAGAAFAPPRHLTAVPFEPKTLAGIISEHPRTAYLALGPLSNLAELARGDPAGFLRIDVIWIPVRLRGNSIADWNLLHDAPAAQAVLSGAGNVVLIDLSAASGLDAAAFFSALEGDSRPVSWMREAVSGVGEHRGHLMLYDELAAAAVLDPRLAAIGDQRYAARLTQEGRFELEADPAGNIRIAGPIDGEGALALLAESWRRGPAAGSGHGGDDLIPARTLLKAFHGHLGPYVVIGYRMGRLALEELGSEGHFGLSAEVHSPLEPPRSCLIDGVQIGSGCTLGKRNIEVVGCDGPAWGVFRAGSADAVTISLRPEVTGLLENLIDRRGVEAAGDVILETSSDSLFVIDRAAGR